MATSSEARGPAPETKGQIPETPSDSLREPAPLQRDIRPRASNQGELKKRDRWMAWGFIVALLVAIALVASFHTATP